MDEGIGVCGPGRCLAGGGRQNKDRDGEIDG